MSSGRSFEWDEGKAQSNLAKLGVPFGYAVRMFVDPWLIEVEASKPEDGEVRHKAVGVIEGRLFTVVYAPRDGVTRRPAEAIVRRGKALWSASSLIPQTRRG